MKKFIEITDTKKFGSLLVIFLTIISLIIVPLGLFFDFLSVSTDYEASIQFGTITMLIIVIGAIISIILLLTLSLSPLSRIKALLLVSVELLYVVYIIVWSRLGYIIIDIEEIFIQFDISMLSLVFLGIPVLSIIKTLYSYRIRTLESYRFAFILKLIQQEINSKTKLIKYISSHQNAPKLKNLNASLKLKELIEHKDRLIRKDGTYHLTLEGRKYLAWIEEHRNKYFSQLFIGINEKESFPLQMWTEEDLRKLNRGK